MHKSFVGLSCYIKCDIIFLKLGQINDLSHIELYIYIIKRRKKTRNSLIFSTYWVEKGPLSMQNYNNSTIKNN